ncbi:hypothetical protein GCM10027445_31440 [Amycolatopsis endophytica]
MRDACSQLSTSADVIESDLQNGKPLLKAYYSEWITDELNAQKALTLEQFLALFDLPQRCYVVLASTSTEFAPQTFEKNTLSSHIARREIITTNHEFKSKGTSFRLAHTKRVKAKDSNPEE